MAGVGITSDYDYIEIKMQKGSQALSFDKKIMRKIVNNIFKQYFSKNVSSQFTAVKKVPTNKFSKNSISAHALLISKSIVFVYFVFSE